MPVRTAPAVTLLAALVLGIATVFAFAPFRLPALPVLTLAGLFALWQFAPSPRAACWQGFAFGLGLFGAGASWVGVALFTFGEMPAAIAIIGTAAFCAWLAVFPALTGWLAVRLAAPGLFRLLIAAGAWAVTEWLRSWLLSGFPWLSLGYSQVPGVLAGYAPIGGVFLVSLIVAALAALLVHAVLAIEAGRRMGLFAGAAAALALLVGGAALSAIEWSAPSGDPVAVSLVQGNVAQEIKFDPQIRDKTMAIYRDLAASAQGRLIVLPESALPMFADEVPPSFVAELRAIAVKHDGDLLTGLFLFEPPDRPGGEDRYFNGVVSVGTATIQVYRKHHLVPFGESIPLKPIFGWFIRNILSIPLADQTPGPVYQKPFAVAGQRVAINICYEDAFGDEIIRQLPDATLMVNVTNDAWYGRSLAAEQHEQMAAMRAIETARPMLRATNTGITALIDHHGVERARLPWFTRGVLETSIAGRQGTTPYVRFGDVLAVIVALVLVFTISGLQRRKTRAVPA